MCRLFVKMGLSPSLARERLHIPAFMKHRVDWITPGEPTVWIGVRYNDHG